eukprot:CAMPEP_0170547552 /NCGR_PEP_ID=MMETSP0211-20121228/5969_1 /TAXON_ID=311385 /ORGANISM="Pseudokeronopsis sp., Strain OXSARD2" /LENGTH=81 /DNA_ID=CAMNT_0010852681 /DNA_START=65 /DNA_END=310 /DNA_ORIENTATION=-
MEVKPEKLLSEIEAPDTSQILKPVGVTDKRRIALRKKFDGVSDHEEVIQMEIEKAQGNIRKWLANEYLDKQRKWLRVKELN